MLLSNGQLVNKLVCLEIFLFFKTQKGHHTVSENIQSNVLFKVLITNAGPCGYFNVFSKKHPRYSLFVKRNNCYRSTTLLFGLGQTIARIISAHLFSDYLQSRLQTTLQTLTFCTFLDTIFTTIQTLLLVTTQTHSSYFQLFASSMLF